MGKPGGHPEAGATGRFPEGKLTPNDEGELAVAVGIQDEKVIIDFGPTPVQWVAFGPEIARQLANVLVDRAETIEKEVAKE